MRRFTEKGLEIKQQLFDTLSPEEVFKFCYYILFEVCNEQGWGDWTTQSRAKEILMAHALGHEVRGEHKGGGDAVEPNQDQAEYKSTVQETIQAAYTGISCKNTWEEQDQYLLNEKLGCYNNHYHARFCPKTGAIKEMYKMLGSVVYGLVKPVVKNQFEKAQQEKQKKIDKGENPKADPRFSKTIGQRDIKKYGKKIPLEDLNC